MFKNRTSFLFSILTLLLLLSILLNISFGQVAIPFKEIFKSIFGSSASKETWDYIIINYRLPKAITAILVGISLSISGLLMQTFFRNPLAGPFVLGLSSGSSLGVAFVVLGSSFLPLFLTDFLLSSHGIILASCAGSFLVLLLIFIVSKYLRDVMSILIVGLMFSSFTSAIVSILTYFSTAAQLQKFTFWSMGSLGNLTWGNLTFLTVVISIGLIISISSLKSLDALLLGENYAKSMGLNFKRFKNTIIISTSLLTGSITAFVGPIAFIGLAVPHLAKLLFQTSNHRILFAGTLLIGAIIMLLCDSISQLPGMDFTLPINAITSLVGAPIVIWLIIKKKNLI
ncbi:iron ABC transporter permease [Flavobacterium capsici]|uniref:Iron ABC transporter permease n=1 Tax=Flavobacterium capsici TaxID=3075618 RepID=A0AA96EUS3_9FLAO|nr:MULTISPECIES: iron ABC transporter permease [unclassified Flavobacterium]WNM18804.1 iron ABC transporter permease [Flavobacterium sp. PMR2A8]WNM22855.1 iron ABC transporter permease [Flavobacterium sp. PMTSA4]